MAEPDWAEQVRVYSEYGQFQVGDRESELKIEWDEVGRRLHMAVGIDVVSIATTTMFGYLDVGIEAWSAEPPLHVTDIDHAVEASLSVRSGLLRVSSVSSDITLPNAVPLGWHRIRAIGRDLSRGAGDIAVELGADRYLVQVWPDMVREPALLKEWPGWSDQ